MIKFSRFLGGDRGALELKPVLFLFSRTVFFGAIEEERYGKTLVKNRVLREGKLGNNCEMNKNEVCLALKCPNFGPLCLCEATFTLAKGPECGKTQGIRRGHAKRAFRFASAKVFLRLGEGLRSPRQTRGLLNVDFALAN